MGRTRRDSLVLDIASGPNYTRNNNNTPTYTILDDTYLINRLEKLSITLGKSSKLTMEEEEESTSLGDDTDESTLTDYDAPYIVYQDYLDQLNANLNNYKDILNKSKLLTQHFNDSLNQYDKISQDSIKFINDTDTLFQKHKELTNKSQLIPTYLNYFDSLDIVMRRLNHASSPAIVKKDSFKKLLQTIDESLIFLNDNANFLDADSYRIKFKQCLIRAIMLISHFNNNSIKNIYNEIIAMDTMLKNISTRDALIYNKFSNISELYFNQISEIINRCYNEKFDRYHDELKSVLNDCFYTYFLYRNRLVMPGVWIQLDEIIASEKKIGFVEFIQSMKTFFQQLCVNEYQLFGKFFPVENSNVAIKNAINKWFLKLCQPLYDTTTSIILMQDNISNLCEVVTLFKPFYEFEEDSDEYSRQFNEIYYNKIFEPITQKLQDQLTKAIKLFVNNTLIKYQPTLNDLMVTGVDWKKIDLDNDLILNDYLLNLSSRLVQDGFDYTLCSNEMLLTRYYVPLIKSMAMLTKVFDIFINPNLFVDLSHYVISNCLESLRKAYRLYKNQSSTLDIKLSTLSNLLLLRDEVQRFNIPSGTFDDNKSNFSFSAVGTIINTIKNSNANIFSFAKNLTQVRARTNSNTSLASISANNNFKTDESDSRIELIHELRNIIKEFTECAAQQIWTNDLIIKETDIKEDIKLKNNKLKKNIQETLPILDTKIINQIHDFEISNHLLHAIKDYIMSQYKIMYNDLCDSDMESKFDMNNLNEILSPDILEELFDTTITDINISQDEKIADQN